MNRYIKPRLITFDVTGTLLMTQLEKHYGEIGSRYGLLIETQKLAGTFKSSFHRLSLQHPIFGKHTGLGWEKWWKTIVYDIFKEQNQHVSDKLLDKVANDLIECYSTKKCWHKYPGTIDLLESLRKRGMILGVISNFDERLEPLLVDLNLRSFFSFVLTSYDFGMEKPNPSIFSEALRLTEEHHGIDIKPEEALHVGDTIDRDYFGAKNSRWSAVLINRNEKDALIKARNVSKDDVVRNLEELQEYFKLLLDVENKKNF